FGALLVFAAAGLATLGADREWRSPSALGTLALVAVPSLILVAETGATNGAQVALAAGLGLGPEPPHATQVGQVVVGLGLALGAIALARPGSRLLGALALAV